MPLTTLQKGGASVSVIDTLVTDRTQADRIYLESLLAKGWEGMTEDERHYFMGESEVPLEDSEGFSLYSSDGLMLLAIDSMAVVKGAYNASDLNRVNEAVAYLSGAALSLLDELVLYRETHGVGADAFFLPPYRAEDVVVVLPDAPWSDRDIPCSTDLAAYLQNVRTLRGLVPLPDNVPTLPASMEFLTFTGANAIESSLAASDAARISLEADIKDLIDKTSAAWYFSGEIYTGEVT